MAAIAALSQAWTQLLQPSFQRKVSKSLHERRFLSSLFSPPQLILSDSLAHKNKACSQGSKVITNQLFCGATRKP